MGSSHQLAASDGLCASRENAGWRRTGSIQPASVARASERRSLGLDDSNNSETAAFLYRQPSHSERLVSGPVDRLKVPAVPGGR